MDTLKTNRYTRKLKRHSKVRNMHKNRLLAIFDRAVREKLTIGRAGISWDDVV